MKTLYTAKDAGCYADGAYGHNHCRDVLAELFAVCQQRTGVAPEGAWETERGLAGEGSDDLHEEDDAIDYLNTVTEGATWQYVDGDLMLVANEEVES